MTKEVKRPTVNLVDPSILTSEEKKTLREEARKRVLAQQRQDTMDAFLQDEIERQRRAMQPAEEIKYINLDMAGHSDRIMLDGVIYFHGQTYEVPRRVYDCLAEVVQRGWEHEDEIGGANRNFYKRPRNATLSRGMEGMAAKQILGVR